MSIVISDRFVDEAIIRAENAYFLSLEEDDADDGDLSEELYDADKALEDGLIDKTEHERLCVKAFSAFDAQEISF